MHTTYAFQYLCVCVCVREVACVHLFGDGLVEAVISSSVEQELAGGSFGLSL